MSLRLILKKQGTIRGRRWIIKRDDDNKIREIKCIFNPHKDEKNKNARPMIGDKKLI